MTGKSGERPNPNAASFSDLADLYAHAHAMELEAEERYAMLADQMEVHNNRELAAFFRRLAEIEGRHADEIKARAGGLDLPRIAPWQYRWPDMEAPEAVDLTDVHYLMTPHHALSLALRAEERAYRFFDTIATGAPDPKIRAMAKEFADEEREHVAQVRDLLAQLHEPEAGWADDPDPPATQE
jgi:rubrerythrin